jgi:hypothetical protein
MSRRLLLLPLFGACTGGMADSTTIEQGACVALEGRRFTSVNDLECGRTPDGVARCKWLVAFSTSDPIASEFSWTYSDVGEVGRASCHDDRTITAFGAREIAGTFDPLTQRLMWAGEVYVADPRP